MSLLSQLRSEQAVWFQYVQSKRQQFRDRIKKKNNQSKGKINITLVANQIDTLISSSYTDLLTVKFVSRDWFFGKEKAEALTYIARFDQQDMEYDQLYYQKEQDRYGFWVSIRLLKSWNQTKSAPSFVAINPLSCIPDPKPSQTGNFSINNYRFIGFNMRTNILELKNSWIYSKEWLSNIIKDYYDAQEALNNDAYNDAYNLQRFNVDTITENFAVDIYHHFTTYKGKKRLVTTDWGMTNVLRQVEIKPVTAEEKKDATLIPRPIAINYWKPVRWCFFGESVWDYLETKQDAMNVFANLAVISAKKEALGWRFLMNSRLIKNKEDVLKPSVETQYFWIDENQLQPWESINNAMIELPQTAVKSDVMWMYNFLENEANKATWVDQLQRGIVPDKSMTKAEAQQIQANSNLLSIRNKRVDSWGDKDFFFLRWRAYVEYMSPRDKKTIVLDNDFENKVEIFKSDVFTYKEMPHIEIWSVAELNALDEKRKQFLSLYLPQVQQDPSKAQIIKDTLEREFLRLQWYSANQVNIFVPLSPDERIMIDDYVPMINNDTVPENMFVRIQDIFTAYLYTLKAQDTKAKTIVLETLKTILTEQDMQWQMQSLEAWGWQMANSAANIQMSQSAQWAQWENLITRENLATQQ